MSLQGPLRSAQLQLPPASVAAAAQAPRAQQSLQVAVDDCGRLLDIMQAKPRRGVNRVPKDQASVVPKEQASAVPKDQASVKKVSPSGPYHPPPHAGQRPLLGLRAAEDDGLGCRPLR